MEVTKYSEEFEDNNTFESLCILASNENWCWNLTCTTCGNMHFRYGFIELANLKSPRDQNWLVNKKTNSYKKVGKFPRAYLFNQKKIIHNICTKANLSNIYNNCTHPIWLGYLGQILAHMKDDSESFKILSKSWAIQLEQMVDENSLIAMKLKDIAEGKGLLSLEDLESCEYSFDFNGVAYE